jgi:hypothetical protein
MRRYHMLAITTAMIIGISKAYLSEINGRIEAVFNKPTNKRV